MSVSFDPTLTSVLNAFFGGDVKRGEEVAERIYAELYRIADAALAQPSPRDTLGATGLVHEAWIRLSGQGGIFENRRRFFAFAARIMHSVLVDHARARGALKRGGGRGPITLAGVDVRADGELDFLELHDALQRLGELDPELGTLVELRFFSDLDQSEIAELCGVSISTVERRWRLARAWLRGELCA